MQLVRSWSIHTVQPSFMQYLIPYQIKTCKKSFWAWPWLLRRAVHGAYSALLAELRTEDTLALKNLIRMDETYFICPSELFSTYIQRKNTNMREKITPAERRAVTLRFLAHTHNILKIQLSSYYHVHKCRHTNYKKYISSKTLAKCRSLFNLIKCVPHNILNSYEIITIL